MKKMLAMLLAALMVMSMVACGNTEPAENKDTTPETTVAPTTEATEACSLLQRRQVNQEVKTLVGLYSYLLQCT